MPLNDILTIVIPFLGWIFIVGSVWRFVAGEIEYRRYERTNHTRSNQRREMMRISTNLKNLKVGKIPYNQVTMVKIWFMVAKKDTDWNWAIWSEYKV